MAGIKPLLGLCIAILATTITQGEDVAELQRLRDKSEDNVIHVTTNNFNRLIGPLNARTSKIIAFHTATHLESKPSLDLKGKRRTFGALAKAHKRESGREATSFFAEIEFNESQALFRSMNVTTLPHITYISPTTVVQQETGMMAIPDSHRMGIPSSPTAMSLEEMAEFVSSVAGVEIGRPEEPSMWDSKLVTSLGAVSALALSLVAYKLVSAGHVQDRRLWLLGSMLVYWFSVSGGMFNVIRKVPFAQAHPSGGGRIYFTKTAGIQLGAEGFMIGSSHMAIGLSVLAIALVAPRIQEQAFQRIAVYSLSAVVAVSLALSFGMYKAKTEYNIRLVGF